jgi:hypothetical protein
MAWLQQWQCIWSQMPDPPFNSNKMEHETTRHVLDNYCSTESPHIFWWNSINFSTSWSNYQTMCRHMIRFLSNSAIPQVKKSAQLKDMLAWGTHLTSRIRDAPAFSVASGSSIARAIVTPSLMTFGAPNSSSTTLRPGPAFKYSLRV